MNSKPKIQLAKPKQCTGCLACADACNHSALKIVKKGELLYPSIDKAVCVGCKLCEKSCPIITPITLNKIEDIRVYGGWATDEELRANSASGGAFAGFAKSFIYQHKGNVAVYGACLKDNRVHHERITSIDELPILMNSKYIQSDTRGIYKKVKDDIKDNRYVLFSGTPCQIAGLYGFLGKKRDDEHLLTIELICAGVMSPEALDLHLEANHSPKIISFRNKVEGQYYNKSQCTTIEIAGKPFRFTKRNDDIFYRCFSCCILERHSCFNCMFAKLTRVADITIGDFWGGNRDFQEYEKGVNVVLINNTKAREFAKNAKFIVMYGSTISKAISGNPCLFSNVNYIQYHPLVMWPNFFRKILPKSTWLNIVKNDYPWRCIWFFFRLLGKLREKKDRKRFVAQYNKIINEWWEEKY